MTARPTDTSDQPGPEEVAHLIPICSNCGKMRDGDGFWINAPATLSAHLGVRVTHGICPDCAVQLYPGVNLGE